MRILLMQTKGRKVDSIAQLNNNNGGFVRMVAIQQQSVLGARSLLLHVRVGCVCLLCLFCSVLAILNILLSFLSWSFLYLLEAPSRHAAGRADPSS